MNHGKVLLLFALIAFVNGRKVSYPLLEFKQISDVKLVFDYENVIFTIGDVYSEVENLQHDLLNLNCEESEVCNVDKKIMVAEIREKSASIQNTFTPTTKHSNRKKRSWEPIGRFLKWSGGIMDSDDRDTFVRYLNQLYDNQTKIAEKLDSVMTQLNKPNELKAERNEEFIELSSDIKHFREKLLLQIFKERFARISKTIDGILSTYVNEKVDGVLINSQIYTSLNKFQHSLRDKHQLACGKLLDCVKNSKAQIEYKNGNFSVILEIPIAEKRSLKLYEVTSIPSHIHEFLLILKPEHKYYAFDESNEEVIAFNDNFKSSCSKLSDSFELYCKTEDIISSVNTHDCLTTALRDKVVYTDVCFDNLELLQLSDSAVMKVDRGLFWVYSKSPRTLSINCNGDDNEEKNIAESEMISLKYGCRAEINSIKMISYASMNNQFSNSFKVGISVKSFNEIIDSMVPSMVLNSKTIYDVHSIASKGLKEKEYSADEAWQQKNQWQEEEIKVLHAEHNKVVILGIIVVACALIFFAIRKHKSIFIITGSKEVEEPKLNNHCDSETSLNLTSNIKS